MISRNFCENVHSEENLRFFVTQILHEIQKISESSKSTVFAILGAINFVNLESFNLEKRTKTIVKSRFRAFKYHVKMVDYETLHSPILISHKI